MTNWYDEEEIVKVVKDHLMKKGYKIRPKWVKTGPDIVAEFRSIVHDDLLMFPTVIVEAKGYPTQYYAHGEKAGHPKPTKPDTQARHWAADAIFTTLLRMAETKNQNEFALAFPRFPIYINLMNRLKEVFRKKFNIHVFIVGESKNVKEFSPTEDVS